MSEKLRVGVIGADLGLRAALVFESLPRERAEIVAIADRDVRQIENVKSKKVGGELPTLAQECCFYASAEELIADAAVEAVFIMVRDCYHAEMAIAALEAGQSVYLEKPMAISIEECDRILETAMRTRSKLFVGHNLRYAPFVRTMKEIIDSGIIGEIQAVWCRHFVAYGSCYFHHWCAERKNCNGLLLQKGAHDIDVIQWLAGAPARKVAAMGRLSVYNRAADFLAPDEEPDRKIAFTNAAWPPLAQVGLNPKMDVEDHNMIIMQLENGVQACYMHCMYTPDSERNYTFIGTKGRLENYGDFDSDAEIHVWTRRGSRKKPDIIYKVPIPSADVGHGGADNDIVASFVEFALGERPCPVSPIAARDAVAAGCMGHEAMRTGVLALDVPPVAPKLAEYFARGQI